MSQQYGSGGGMSVRMAGPFGGSGASSKITEITLAASAWKGATSPYSQVVAVEGISVNSKVDLQPSVAQVSMLHCVLTAENNEGTVTVYAIGEKPTADIIMQATLTEVVA